MGWGRYPALLRRRRGRRFFCRSLADFLGRHFLQHLTRRETPEAKSGVEIFRTSRILTTLPAGQTLRIADHSKFRVTWSKDNWATVEHLDSVQIGKAFYQADIPTAKDESGTITFTLEYPAENRWLGRNYDVAIVAPSALIDDPAPSQVTPSDGGIEVKVPATI